MIYRLQLCLTHLLKNLTIGQLSYSCIFSRDDESSQGLIELL